MRRIIQGWIALVLLAWATGANPASTPFTLTNESTQDYDLYPGDFNGDGFTDLLYIAKDPSNASGIILSDGTNLSIPFQSWSSNYLGISWSSNSFNVIVADFNGDGKADILLQSKLPGDSYLLLTGSTGVTAISQTIPVDTAGVIWSADQHSIVAGDFNGDGKADVFMQATTPAGLNAVIAADANGQFTATEPTQSWNDGYLGFGWATTESNIFAGDFNGDGRADLLIQAQPTVGTGPSTPQPAEFLPNMNGVVLAQSETPIFAAAGVQAWSENGFSADWSSLDSDVVLGDFNGDGRMDAILQGLTSTNPTYLLYGNAPGQIFLTATSLSSEVSPSADNFRLIPGHFDGASGDSLFMQSQIRGQSNYLGRVNGGSITGAVPPTTIAPATPSSGTSDRESVSPAMAGAIVAPTASGRTAGEFSVSSTGSAVYTIPLQTPPGAGGAQLALALTYNSRLPNGTVGVGWGVNGLSAISRCNKTYAQDGSARPVILLETDRLCLDGQQLKLTGGTVPNYVVAGSQYATEIESFAQIIANGLNSNVTSFTVKSKNGLIYTYGGTTDSEVSAGSSGIIRTWALSQIADRVGNKISLVYQQSNGTYRIDHILYPTTASGQGPFYEVLFTYGPRPPNDIPASYIDGYLVTEPNQLNSITTEVYPAGTVIKVYNLQYTQGTTTNRNTLTALQECSASTCLPATSVTYQFGTAGWSTSGTSLTTTGTPVFADLNGDGIPDLIYVDAGSRTVYFQLGTSSGYTAPVHTGYPASEILTVGHFLGNGSQQVVYTTAYDNSPGTDSVLSYNASSGTYSTTTLTTTSFELTAADIDGDGLDDLIEVSPNLEGTSILSLHNTTVPPGALAFASPVTVWTAPSGQIILNTGVPGGVTGNVRVADFNGDGRADVLAITVDSSNNYYTTPLVSNGASEPFTALATWKYTGPGPDITVLPIITDWNGDGCTDVVTPNSTYTYINVQISNCAGGFAAFQTTLVPSQINSPMSVDWDGDGRQDLFYYTSSLVPYVLQSTGTGQGRTIPLSFSVSYGAPTVADVNGDGLADIVFPGSASAPGSIYLHNGANMPPDLAISFTDGFGMNQSPTYVTLTNPTYYDRYTTAVYPEVDYDQALYVVNQVTASDGTGDTYQNEFYYEGARRQVQGRGFEGFYTRRQYDTRNALYTWDYFGLTFPNTGIAFQRALEGSANELRQWTGTLSVQALTGLGGYEVRWFPYLGTETTTLWETGGPKNGDQISQSTKTTTYGDGYGNPTQIVTSTTDQDSTAPTSPFNGLTWTQTINATYFNDTTHNCLGLPATLSDQRAVPSQTTQTRNYSYLADTTNCRTTQKTIEPGVSGLQVTTVYGFDTCGNIDSVAVTGENSNGTAMTTRTTAYNYSYTTSRCQLPEQTTNALGQSAETSYNYNFGVRASATDPNGLVTSWLQDDYGRDTQETDPDGTYTTTSFSSCSVGPCWGVTDLRFQAEDVAYGSDSSLINERYRYFDGFNRLRYDESYRSNGLGNSTVLNFDAIRSYDSLGRQVQVVLPFSVDSNGYVQWSYDVLNRQTSYRMYQPSGTLDRTTTTAYLGRTTETTDPRSNTVSRVTDVVGKLREVIDPSPGGTTRYAYDAFGNPNSTVDAIGATASATFNLRGFRTQMVDPDMGTWNYMGDSLNELVSWTDAKSQPFSVVYDLLGRVQARTEPEGTSNWTWGSTASLHNIGQLQQITGYGYTENLSYDSVGRISSRSIVTDQAYSYNYAYNPQGLLATVTYPTSPVPTGTTGANFEIEYTYSAGEPVEIQDITNSTPVVLWTSVSNNDSRLPTQETIGASTAAVLVTTGYKAWTSEILSIQAGTGGSTTNLQNLGYTWDTTDNLTQRGDANQSGTCSVNGSSSKLCEIFTPDALNRVSSSTLSGTSNLTIGYDAAGDITSKSDVGTYTYPSPTSAHPHGATAAGSNSYTYDSNGNAETKNGLTQTWASYNLPITLQGSPSGTTFTSQFSYGPEHERYQEVSTFSNGTETTEFVGDSLEKLTTGSPAINYWRHYVSAPSGEQIIISRNSDLSTSKAFVLTDHLGSSDTVVNGVTGALIIKESSGAFGQRRESNWTAGVPSTWYQTAITEGTRRGFGFHEQLDGVGLIHMNGRVYDPTIGKFLSVDPIAGDGGDSQRLNPYAYINNRPLTGTDPSGLDGQDGWSVPIPPPATTTTSSGVQDFSQLGQISLTPPDGSAAQTTNNTGEQITSQPAPSGSNSPSSGTSPPSSAPPAKPPSDKKPVNPGPSFAGVQFSSSSGIYVPGPFPALHLDLGATASLTVNGSVNAVNSLGNVALNALDVPLSFVNERQGEIISVESAFPGGGFAAAGTSGLAKISEEIEEASAANLAVREGSFSIVDWSGYPAGVPKPTGPFRLLEGSEYTAARAAANRANGAFRGANPEAAAGKEVHEIQPIKFGGSPTDPGNKLLLTKPSHRAVTTWWLQLQRSVERTQQ